MARGGARANAGRKQGKPNALNAKARERAAASGLLPLDYLLSIVRNDSEAQDVRIDAAKAAAPYLHARLASIDMTSKTLNCMQYHLQAAYQSTAAAGVHCPHLTITSGPCGP